MNDNLWKELSESKLALALEETFGKSQEKVSGSSYAHLVNSYFYESNMDIIQFDLLTKHENNEFYI